MFLRKAYLAIAAGLLWVVGGCSEDFTVAAPYKDVTLAFAVLDVGDSAHYIRIQKAFLDEARSAIDLAKESDSNYFRNLTVTLRQLDAGSRAVQASFDLPRVDLAAEGIRKDDGTFFTSPTFAYKFDAPLLANRAYRLVVRNNADGSVDSAETALVDPGSFKIIPFEIDTALPINFAEYGRAFTILISGAPQGSALTEGLLRFRYEERDPASTIAYKSFDYSLGQLEAGALSWRVENANLYAALATNIGAVPAGYDRFLDSVDILITSGSQSFLEYIRAQSALGGITGDQIRPIYTNFYGQDVLGLFASRATRRRLNVPIATVAIDSLQINPVTASLGIRGRSSR